MKSRTRAGVRDRFIAFAFVATASLAGLIGVAAPAEAASCQSEWRSSVASQYCSNTVMTQVAISDQDNNVTGHECDITTSCSFDVTYGSGGRSSVTVTPSLSLAVFDIEQVPLITICVTESTSSDGSSTYSARVAPACNGTNEYTAVEVIDGEFHD